MMQDKDKIAEYDRLAAENSELKSELENLRKQIACLKKAVYGPTQRGIGYGSGA